ncbi:hypothetical protein DFR67_12231 [Williamsia limnetica]|uniref:MaoC dehydratase-like protein n=1 Tax=Williamsia limnetica TaxID=882452 RepID=A0A318RBH8_WILLI|nr:hypothetical protein [Williamsia limnetica]PYE12447.1 hypothetical protein DFR67_12231 [Williamsia limnetica]
MTTSLAELSPDLAGRELPGDHTTVTEYESRIADHALLRPSDDRTQAHSLWFLVIALRGMGISVEELCTLAHKRPQDTLLFGTCEIEQRHPLEVGSTYRTTATITDTGRRTTRDGSVLDSVTVVVTVFDDTERDMGSVESVYLFKRGRE